MKYKIKYLSKNWKYYWINLLDNRGLYLNLNDFSYLLKKQYYKWSVYRIDV